jgi:hypothetical protein
VDTSNKNIEKLKKEENDTLETEIKGLQAKQVSLLKEKLSLLHKERELAQTQVLAVDAKKKEIFRMEQGNRLY